MLRRQLLRLSMEWDSSRQLLKVTTHTTLVLTRFLELIIQLQMHWDGRQFRGLPCLAATVGGMWQFLQTVNTVWNAAVVRMPALAKEC